MCTFALTLPGVSLVTASRASTSRAACRACCAAAGMLARVPQVRGMSCSSLLRTEHGGMHQPSRAKEIQRLVLATHDSRATVGLRSGEDEQSWLWVLTKHFRHAAMLKPARQRLSHHLPALWGAHAYLSFMRLSAVWDTSDTRDCSFLRPAALSLAFRPFASAGVMP